MVHRPIIVVVLPSVKCLSLIPFTVRYHHLPGCLLIVCCHNFDNNIVKAVIAYSFSYLFIDVVV